MRKYLFGMTALLALMLASLGVAANTPSAVGTGPSGAFSPDTSSAAGRCSKAEATAVVKRLRVSDPSVADPVFKVLCGAFTGPRSQTMVASIYGPGNTGMVYWAVFRLAGGAWQLLMKRHQAALLTAAGSDIGEKVLIYREGDSRCCPSGGTRSRIWHWNGTSFGAGPWEQATKAEPEGRSFYSPSRGIDCGMVDERRMRAVICQTLRPPQKVTMDALGRLKICSGSEARCKLGNAGEDVPVLAYGRQIIVGRFRCLSLRSGMRCTLIRTGRGFVINRDGVSRVSSNR